MVLGHPAVALATKRAAPQVSLGWLIAAPLWLDLIWPVFLLLGLESVRVDPGNTVVTPLDLHDFPWSHSLLMSLVWSLVLGALYFALRRDRVGAIVVGALVFSHWLFDFVVHDADLPLYPGSTTYLGLGLWNSLAGTLVVEFGLLVGGVWIYVMSTRARNRTGIVSLWAMVGTFVLIYAWAVFGPPPDEAVIPYGALLGWLFVPWGAWVERHREFVSS